MDFSPTSNGCNRGIECTADINGQCPAQLKAPGGCNNPCTVFKIDQYCCNSGSCEPTNFSKFFKDRCPNAYSYPMDDPASTFTCPGGTDYRVMFCPHKCKYGNRRCSLLFSEKRFEIISIANFFVINKPFVFVFFCAFLL
ncbi:hypothetical protein ACJRO7_018401 [Eucalyptus globulus]|uniref:Thaumatin-like protein n=1 Tax=Eucalyptus globulus TaxID=34317 RepID=A0ABD3KTN1_EUCGL